MNSQDEDKGTKKSRKNGKDKKYDEIFFKNKSQF